MVVFFFEHCTPTKVYLSGDTDILKKKENILYLGNHQSNVDWIICNMLAIRQGSIGHLRYVMKDTLQMLPLYGFYFFQHGCIYVKRGNFKQNKMEEALKYLQNKKIQSWIVMFPEGTFWDPKEPWVIAKSIKVALDLGIKPYNHHLTPRSKGTFLTLQHLRGSFDAIYDITSIYSGSIDKNGERLKTPGLTDFLKGNSPALQIHIRRIPLSEVPEEETEFKRWMQKLFVEKDRFMEQFYRHDGTSKRISVTDLGKQERLSLWKTLPSTLFFMACFVPFFLFPKYALLILFVGSLGGYVWLAIKAVA